MLPCTIWIIYNYARELPSFNNHLEINNGNILCCRKGLLNYSAAQMVSLDYIKKRITRWQRTSCSRQLQLSWTCGIFRGGKWLIFITSEKIQPFFFPSSFLLYPSSIVNFRWKMYEPSWERTQTRMKNKKTTKKTPTIVGWMMNSRNLCNTITGTGGRRRGNKETHRQRYEEMEDKTSEVLVCSHIPARKASSYYFNLLHRTTRPRWTSVMDTDDAEWIKCLTFH